MEVLHPELQNQPGENDAAKSLVALNMAQDYMESVLAQQADLLGDSTGTVATVANVETTAFPSTLLRLDKLQYLDPTTQRPVYELRDIRRTGGHIAASPWPINLVATTGAQPEAYYTDGTSIYWSPLPNGVYNVRWYGFASASDITASGTFVYRDICMTPIATMAVMLVRIGLDDDVSQYTKLANDIFDPVVNVLSNFQRERAAGLNYRYNHET